MNKNVKRAIFLVLTISICIFIFCFSSQNADSSTKTSNVFVIKIVDLVSRANKNVDKNQLTENVTIIVRKGAHFSIYAALGFCYANFLSTYIIEKKYKLVIYSVIFVMLYSISDELHQTFVNGRSGELRDVILDTLRRSIRKYNYIHI